MHGGLTRVVDRLTGAARLASMEAMKIECPEHLM